MSLAHSSEAGGTMVSRLYLKHVTQEDKGNYTCGPLGLPKAHVTLHVIEPVEEQRLSVTSSANFGAKSVLAGNLLVHVIAATLLVAAAVRC